MSPLLFISCSRSLSLFLVDSLACRLLSIFLCLSLALFSKFVDMTINLSLILQTTRIRKQFPLSFIVFIDSSVVSALKDSGGYAISSQNNLELHLGCYTCWLSYFTLVLCLWCGRTVGGGRCTVTCLPNFLEWIDFLSYGTPPTRVYFVHAWSSAIIME